jgi:hypothetical protein
MQTSISSQSVFLTLTSIPSVGLVSILALIASAIFFVVALWNFRKAAKSKLRLHYARGFSFSGHGFLVLGLLQLFLSRWLDHENLGGARFTIILFIAIGAALSFIGAKLKSRTNGNK